MSNDDAAQAAIGAAARELHLPTIGAEATRLTPSWAPSRRVLFVAPVRGHVVGGCRVFESLRSVAKAHITVDQGALRRT